MDAQRRAILESVQRVRDGIDPHRHAPFAQHTMRIPEGDYYALAKLFPGLAASDPDARAAAHDQLYASPLGEKYHVGKVRKGVTRNGLILPHEHSRK
jgi:hypothetical protein